MATRKCAEYFVEYKKELSHHLKASDHVIAHLRGVHRHVSSCLKPYKCIELHEYYSAFAQKLIYAAVSYDLFSKTFSRDTKHSKPITLIPPDTSLSSLVLLFYKTTTTASSPQTVPIPKPQLQITLSSSPAFTSQIQ